MNRFKNKIFKVFSAMIFVVILCSLTTVFFSGKNLKQSSFAENLSDTTSFLQGLSTQTSGLTTSYILSDDYALDGGNQLTTDFCWLFSSLKCLETSYMLQENEYYNFSEIGMAYLNFIAKKSLGSTTFNSTGNMFTFYNIARQYGVVFENDVSNDYLLYINESNYENYEFILEKANTNLIDNVNIVSFGENSYFSSLSYNSQILTMKAFIKNYGALFLAVGNGDGIIFKTSGMSEYSYTYSGHEYDESVTMNKHAVVLVGWNEKGFIALNSWGNGEDYYQYFCIPYDIAKSKLNELMLSVRGFVVEDNSVMEIKNGSSNQLENVFYSNQNISLKYKISDSVNLNNSKIEIFKGEEDVTYNFEINFDLENSIIQINDKFSSSLGNFGGYVISLSEDNKGVARESFLILSSAEVASVSLEKKVRVNEYEIESLAQNNSFLTEKTTATYFISPYSSYRIIISLSDFAKCKYLASDGEWKRFKDSNGLDKLFEVSTIRVQNIEGNSSTYSDTDLTIQKYIDYDLNSFEFLLPSFLNDNSVYQNKLLTFDIIINSTDLNGEQSKLTFMIFVGSIDGVNTNQNLEIRYELDGGKNNELNITNFPNYQDNSYMTSVPLKSPTKSGYEFLGWYKDKDFNEQVLKISNEFVSDLVLYARWDSADIEEYVLTNIEISEIKDYLGTSKDIFADIIYGDSIALRYNFAAQGELVKYSYNARVVAYYICDGQKTYIEDLNNYVLSSSSQMIFRFDFPKLLCGNYEIFIEAIISVNNVMTLETAANYNFNVVQKSINLEFYNLSKTYDGEAFIPEVKARDGDVFAEDVENFEYFYSLAPQKNVGTYSITIELKNDNYKISQESQNVCIFEILPKKLSVIWSDLDLVYNALNQKPKFDIVGIIEGDYCQISLKEQEFLNVGTYEAEIDTESISNSNYYVLNERHSFKILPAQVTIEFNDITEKLKVAPKYRKAISFEVGGDIFSGVSEERKEQLINLMQLTLLSDGLTAGEFGKYKITATVASANFDVEIIDGTYNLTAPYKVFYKMPDGSIIEELVEEGCQPSGISREEYGYTIFQKLEYSAALYGDGTSDLHITVAVRDYTIYYIVGFVIASLIITYLVVTHKQRRNKVS